jgi:GNAT superfamily N-acetyltransferase
VETLIAGPSAGSAAMDLPELVSWLDSMLREGSEISIADDAPFLFEDSERVTRRVILSDGIPAAHASACEITIDLPGGSVRAAIIGAVATAADCRRRGLGSRVMTAILEDLAAKGVALAILWADVAKFYERLGFVLAGRETIFVCPRAAWNRPRQSTVRLATAADLPEIAELHDLEICRARRDEKAWHTLFGLPKTSFYVLERHGSLLAYGVVGRGYDLAGCLHEWGGDELLLPALVSSIAMLRDETQLYVMSPPWKQQATRAMSYHGIGANQGALGMIKVLDREALLRSLGWERTPGLPDDHGAFVRAVLGCPEHAEPPESSKLPVPFYLFGLDSM